MLRTFNAMLLILLCVSFIQAENSFQVGLKIHKVPNLYYENGLVLDYSPKGLLNDKLHLSLSVVSSRLGSALGSNALKQEEYLLSAGLLFRQDKLIQPLVRLNTGLFMLDTESSIFSELPNKSALLSLECGLGYHLMGPVDMSVSVGYNLIAGTGVKGPGTLYPVFLNLIAFYAL